MPNDPRLHKANQLLEQARSVNERPRLTATDREQVQRLLDEAFGLKAAVEADTKMDELDGWLSEPQYKHDMNMSGLGDVREHGAKSYGNAIGAAGGVSALTKAWLAWVRTGDMPSQHKADLVENATGQNLVPTDFAGTIVKALSREGTIRPLASIYPAKSNIVDLGSVSVGSAGWGKLETGTTPTDGLGSAAKDTITVWDLNALVKLGRDELADADSNLESIIRTMVSEKFAELEDDAYAAGTGTAQPWGIATRATGGVITQAITATANATVTGDDLKKLPFAVPARFRKNGTFLMHSSAAQSTALLKDTTGAYLVQPAATEGEPDRLFGYKMVVSDGLPAMTTTGTAVDPAVIFGDVHAGYLIADRQPLLVQRLTELYAESGKVGLLFTLRVGADVVRPGAFAKYLL